MKYIILLFLTFLAFRLEASLQNIPDQEAKKIKNWFEFLINEHDFSYVIFGSKPMALADVCLWMPDVPMHRRLRARMLLTQKIERLEAWYKYKKEFKLTDFILLDKEEDLFKCLVIVLMHKPHMLTLLRCHKEVFKQVLGDFDPELFLEKIEKREVSLAQAIHHHDGLLGIMLGYGVRNSMLFQERSELLKEIEKRKGVLAKENEWEKRIQKINSQLGSFNEFEDFSVVMPLHFAADTTHPETIELRKRYKIDQEKISELMKKPNFMDGVLERLVE